MRNRFLVALIAIALALVLGIGGMYLLTLGIRGARAMLSRGEVSADIGTVNYLSAYYKMKYLNGFRIIGMNVEDNDEFWNSEIAEGVTYGEDFENKFDKYLRTLIIAADTYHTDHGYTTDDRIAVKYAVDTILAEYAEGSVSVFNSMSAKFGFDYNDFQNAVALLYKANGAMELIYGEGGKNIYEFPEICAEHFSEYSHVSLIFIRLDGTYLTDDEGNYLYDADGEPAIRDLTEEEHDQRVEVSQELITMMTEGEVSADRFMAYLEYNDGDGEYRLNDYYFHRESKITSMFAENYSEVVAEALVMNVGEIRIANVEGGVCFIYRHANSTPDYESIDNPFLADFNINASSHQYENTVAPFLGAVKTGKSYESFSALSVPELNDFYVREFNTKKNKSITVEE